MDFAELCFQRIPFKLQFAYNAMIRGYSTHGFFEKALFLYSKMLYSDSTPPDKFTFPFILKSCAALSAPSEAREAHGRIIKTGLASDVHISTSLVDFYMKLGEVGIARQVFDKIPLKNTVCWNALIAGYAYNESDVEAVDAFKWMIELGFEPNSSTMASVLPAVGRLGDLEEGKLMHKLIIEKGVEIKEPVINSLIAMYGKCGEMETARQLFDEMLGRTAVSWTVMISTYAQNGKFAKALELFICMQAYGVKPTAVTVASMLPACADMMHIKLGMKVHGYSIKNGFDLDIIMSTALVDMYAKCGCIAEARRVFDEMPERNIVSWNAMINAFGLHGQVMDALEWFAMMQLNGMKPNGSTFVSLISACSHAGMVAEGLECFKSMSKDYDLVPETKHYACVVDLLGRAGRLKEAYELIKAMPLEPDDSAWGALLGACRVHKDVELGKMAALKALELKPREPGYYVLLTNIYAGSGRWADAQKLREVMKEKKILKEAGCSSIEDGGIVHSFVVGDSKHPEWKKIYKKMEEIEEKLKEEGYVPDTSLVLHEEIEKSERLAMHSERIALAFGLLKIPDGIPIKITKNLRVCGDCHSAFKLASRIYKREIVLRDLRRFHTFESGNCSCKDYW
uniref:Pentatricopeptide repeat-containing protein At3g12770-like n=1 Tax=Elaeis guineensis var. tenera TaxID=51953 RepID=A0A6I9RR80_ELAGV|nr:pentatricopeptide repeat-containing protein At3g12770-like [Elaeis guineensis]